jgi:glycosyltransferase involved in cell wall biosynthesis
MKIIIGIPAYNEEEKIADIILKLKEVTDTIIVCNDGSSDLTKQISEENGAIVISHEKNEGYGSAIRTIFLKAKELEADMLITFDADGQHRIEDIDKVILPIKNNQADIVIGSRFLENSSKIPKYRKLGINIITKVTNSTINEKITDSQSGFRAYNKKTLEKINPTEKGMGISTEILIKASKINLIIVEVPITVLYAKNTSTHNPVSHGTSVIISTIKYTSIEHPLKFYGIPSLIFLIIGLTFTFFSLDYYSEIGRLNTNLTIIAGGTILLGITLFLTSILLYTLTSVVRENARR